MRQFNKNNPWLKRDFTFTTLPGLPCYYCKGLPNSHRMRDGACKMADLQDVRCVRNLFSGLFWYIQPANPWSLGTEVIPVFSNWRKKIIDKLVCMHCNKETGSHRFWDGLCWINSDWGPSWFTSPVQMITPAIEYLELIKEIREEEDIPF